jgi:tRNA modification GTPase
MSTIYAALSPLIPSAVIAVRISGIDACKVLEICGLSTAEPRRVYHAEYNGSVKDDVLVTFFKGPFSYTGEDVIEISFHGNPLIVTSAFGDFQKLGFCPAEPGEFTKRAFLNGKIDLTQAESVAELISSKTARGIEYSYSQLKGSMRKEIEAIRDIFIDVLTIIEAHIDFPEEDIADAHEEMVFEYLKGLQGAVSEILDSYKSHKVLKDGFSIAIVGKPNTGKSSLMNYLLREDRSIVSSVAGTTRDYIESTFVLGGVPVSVIDTAGMRFTDDEIEKAGIEKSLAVIKEADLVLVLLDASSDLDHEDANVLEMTKGLPRIAIANKIDAGNVIGYEADCFVSVKSGLNMSALLSLCAERVSLSDSDQYSKAVMVTERQKGYFDQISSSIERLMQYSEIDFDIFEYELNSSLRLLSEITGLSYTEDILSNIFDNFCIGK